MRKKTRKKDKKSSFKSLTYRSWEGEKWVARFCDCRIRCKGVAAPNLVIQTTGISSKVDAFREREREREASFAFWKKEKQKRGFGVPPVGGVAPTPLVLGFSVNVLCCLCYCMLCSCVGFSDDHNGWNWIRCLLWLFFGLYPLYFKQKNNHGLIYI